MHSGVQKFARTVFEDVTVQRASVAAANVHVLLLTGNAIRMFAETAGLGMYFKIWVMAIIYSDISKLCVLQSHPGRLPPLKKIICSLYFTTRGFETK